MQQRIQTGILIKFSVVSWEDDVNVNIIQDLHIDATVTIDVFSFKTKVDKIKKVEETSLKFPHEETDF